ncbi:18.3 kDa class I heat shock protein [Rhynchospora pubera]|uniref:18.3 kDa class I heat shock protein n=1 Tax=Rhynchospora pubera TaxID=906938 RepID=A0AAV8HKF0_9POAL|nr:18.3 kDa class I heat shock protein [Rhynchospora pubera]
MPPKRALEIRPGDHNTRKWHVALTEGAFLSFLTHGGDAAKAVFGEGSLFSPFLFGKFFDPADAFPLWDFDSDALLSGLWKAKKTSVDWAETDSEYVLRAELPGGKKCDVEINGDKTKVIEISGQWRSQQGSGSIRDWRTGRWWENGFVRRLELPEDANWKKAEAYLYDDGFLEIRIARNISAECSTHQRNAGPGESDTD